MISLVRLIIRVQKLEYRLVFKTIQYIRRYSMKAINACAFIIIGFFLPQNFSFSSTQGQHAVSHNKQAEKEMYVIFCSFVPFCHKLYLQPTSLHSTSTKWSQSYLLETVNLEQKPSNSFNYIIIKLQVTINEIFFVQSFKTSPLHFILIL